jgi:tRNA (guanine37-N1)-methyltransferase
VDEEISMGDFVVTGGEIPAMALADAVCRMVPGVLPDEECFTDESHWDGLLEYPQYSRPEEWHGRKVPEVLLSGHHENVALWRKKESYKRTMLRRPDLFESFDESKLTSKKERKNLAEAKAEVAAMKEE